MRRSLNPKPLTLNSKPEQAALAPEAWSHGPRFVGGDLLVNMEYAGSAAQGVVKIVGVFTGTPEPRPQAPNLNLTPSTLISTPLPINISPPSG